MRYFSAVAALVFGAISVHAQPAPRATTTLPAVELSSLDSLRKTVWVNWFSGDTAALRRVLGPELIAISGDSKYWQTLDQSLAGSAEFKRSGGKLVSVSFDSTKVHRVGDMVVMFSRYQLVTAKSGKQSTQRGRATEVFVRRDGKWVHTSWHLDSDSP